jgi:RepB DNA-primase from phage plasmid
MRPYHANLDLEPAHRFLRLLDPRVSRHFTFQTFHDQKPPTKGELAQVIESPGRAELIQLHALGAGVYVTVNATDGGGRKSKNVTRIRAVWQEDDQGFDGSFPLSPSTVVETSPGHYHRYWLVADDWPADDKGRADFGAVMERMVESYGSDRNAKDICRVMRLPGFLHRKGNPQIVRIAEASGKRYTRAEILVAFPPVEKKSEPRREWKPRDDDDQRIREALDSINADERDIWLQCGMALKDEMGDAGRVG